MLSKPKRLSNFSNAVKTSANCLRPENEEQISRIFIRNRNVLARGNGVSYSDCCLNHQGTIVETTRLNHLLSFDEITGLLTAQGGVSFADLFAVNPSYIPPVIPGTLRATLAGGVANDIHGKNNHHAGSFGQHLAWIDLQLGNQLFHCSPTENKHLFYATIGGLGLTGIIKRLAFKMRKASAYVLCEKEKYVQLDDLLQRMQSHGLEYDYQVAWLDLLHESFRAILSLANHTETTQESSPHRCITIPRLPCRLIYKCSMRWFNRYYFSHAKTEKKIVALDYFNNPLDGIQHWNRLYGNKGLLQFQAVFTAENATNTIEKMIALICQAKATPTLAVLKYFTQPGSGLLSFTQPGFTLAIDFINNSQARQAILAMNAHITQIGGKIYLAKDLLLAPEEFCHQYPNHDVFKELLSFYKSPMSSDLSRRLGITA